MKVPFAAPECGEEEIQEAIAVIKSGWLTTASRTQEFETKFAAYVGARHCLAVNSGTAALHLALEALGVGPGDRVLVPVHTFTATAEVVRYMGADPAFVDCDPETFCISAREIGNTLEAHSTEQDGAVFKAVIPVHFGGHPCDMDEIMDTAGRHELKVIEDAAHAFPTLYRSSNGKIKKNGRRMIGTIGDGTCFSFYANKTITTGEGGMFTTDDDSVAERVRVMRLHGINRDVWNRFSDTQADWAYDVIAPGYKYNLPDLAAALGIHQLRKADQFRKRRQEIAETYYRELKQIPGVILPRIKCSMEDHAWHLFVVLIDSEETPNGITRDAFLERLRERNIGTAVHYIPLHRMTYYKERYGLEPSMFPNSEWVFQGCASLPIYSAMTDSMLEYVIESIKDITEARKYRGNTYRVASGI